MVSHNITAGGTGGTESFLNSGLSGEHLQIAILVSLFLAITARTYLYFIVEKRKAEKLGEPPLKFDTDFIVTAILSAIGSGFVALLTFNESAALVPEGTSIVGVFVIVGGFAFGSNEILNKVLSFIDFNRILESPKLQNTLRTKRFNNTSNNNNEGINEENKV